MKTTTTLWALIGVLLVAVCAVAVYRAWPLLFPKVAISIPHDPSCDLRAGPCTSMLNSGSRVSFAIEPHEIPLVKPLRLRVEIQDLEAQQVEVDFSGVDMNMGFNRFKLSRTGEGEFTGEGILPICVRDAMEWEAKVLVTTPRGLTAAAYRFITVRPGLPIPGHTD
ncbi:MAG: hypothetical protein PVI92_12140 [Chromatiales bacterium]